jgi:hypothetical protein
MLCRIPKYSADASPRIPREFRHGNIASHFSKRKYSFCTDMRYDPKMSHKVVTVGWYKNVVS